jgi:hypothetical protein
MVFTRAATRVLCAAALFLVLPASPGKFQYWGVCSWRMPTSNLLVNLGEICYLVERRRGLRDVHRVLAVVESLPVEVLPADRAAVLVAAHLKARHSISFADAFAAAAAQTYSTTFLTNLYCSQFRKRGFRPSFSGIISAPMSTIANMKCKSSVCRDWMKPHGL